MERPEIDVRSIAHWTSGRWCGEVPDKICGVGHDSRSIAKGMLFVAIKGENFDGHDYLEQVFASGAAAAMVSVLPKKIPGPCLLVDDTVTALGRLAHGWRCQNKALLIAVTGSAGKTTVKDMIVHLLGAAAKTAGTRGNWNNNIGLPLSILAMPTDCRYGVFEVGTNHPGELRLLCDILQPEWGVVTVIGAAHLENFGSLSAIAREKCEVLRCLPAEGRAFINADCEFAGECMSSATAPVLSVSMSGCDADLNGAASAGNGAIIISGKTDSGEVVIPYKGPCDIPHMRNALLAVAVARTAGIEWAVIGDRMQSFVTSAMRWQRRVIGLWTVINDAYNANPLSMQAALEALQQEGSAERTWLVLGDMLELGPTEESEHREIGRLAAAGNWRGLLTVGQRARWIAMEAVSCGVSSDRVQSFDDAAEAASFLSQSLDKGDVILLKASRGMKLEIIEEKICQIAGQA